jgi:hypothetical protein
MHRSDGSISRGLLCALPHRASSASLLHGQRGASGDDVLSSAEAVSALRECAVRNGASLERAELLIGAESEVVALAVSDHAHWWARQRVRLSVADLVARRASRAGAAVELLVVIVGAHTGDSNDPIFGVSSGNPSIEERGAGFAGFLRLLLPLRQQSAPAPCWRPTVVFVEPVPALMEQLLARHDNHCAAAAAAPAASPRSPLKNAFVYEPRFIQAAVCNETRHSVPFYVVAAEAAAANAGAAESPYWFHDQLGSLEPAHVTKHGIPMAARRVLDVECLSYAALLARLARDRTLHLPRRTAGPLSHPDVLVIDAEGSDIDIVAHVLDKGETQGPFPLLLLYEEAHGDAAKAKTLAERLVSAGYACERVSETDVACVRVAVAAAL